MSLWVIIPVKPLRYAKSRLSPVLQPEERFELALAMLRQVLAVSTALDSVAGVMVVSRDTKALAVAREFGAKTLQEGAASNLNPALMRATQVLKGWRADAVLILPADLPFVTRADLSQLIALARDDAIVIATDRAEDGTNALLLRPAGALEYAYGPGSYQRHIQQAAAAGLQVIRFDSESMALDIDVPSDLLDYQEMLAAGDFGHLPALSLDIEVE